MSHPFWRVFSLAAFALGGCAAAGKGNGGEDLARPPADGAVADRAMATMDQAGGPADQAVPGGDLAGVDQAAGGDLAAAKDLAAAPDLAMRDLASPPDLATPPDLVALPDLARPPDMASGMCVPQMMPCDVVCQNCAQNQKCSINNMGASMCYNAGNVGSDQACGQMGTDNCAAGLLCVAETGFIPLNLCRYFCRVDGDCKNGGKCVWTINGTMVKVCSDPIVPCTASRTGNAGCNVGGCYIVTPQGDTGCHRVGPGGSLDPCQSDYDCQAGYTCDQGACVRICRKGNNGDCPNVFWTCANVNGWNSYGICRL